MREHYKRVFSAVAIVLLLLPFYIGNADVSSSIAYLKTKGQNPWSTMALVSAGEPVDVSYLISVSADSAIELEAPILALAAAGENPRTYPERDLIAALKNFYVNGQIGDAALLNDDIFGVLALLSSGESAEDVVVAGARDFIVQNQNDDGGWPFAVGGGSDTNTTAMAIMALLEAGIGREGEVIEKAVLYLRSAQNDDGGFPYDPESLWGTASDASSDAWVISAIYKLGEDPLMWTKGGGNPLEHLLSLEREGGYFEYQEGTGEDSFSPITTSYAVIALSGRSYPVGYVTALYPQVSYRIEGKDNTLCDGSTAAPNPLELIKLIADACGFAYHIASTSFGPYLNRIGDDEAAGSVGWLYAVNLTLPSVGAADYTLKEGDEVLWYFGEFGWQFTRITLDRETALSGESVTVTVEFLHDGSWSPLPGADVYAGVLSYETDIEGQVTEILPDGAYRIFAEKNGFVRSEKELLVVGEREEAHIALSAVISESGGSGGQDFISFVVSAHTLDFGLLTGGRSVTKEVLITNDGQMDIYLESVVSGDHLFTDNITIDDESWRTFNAVIAKAYSRSTAVTLKVPQISTSGEKRGTLTFWAIQTP